MLLGLLDFNTVPNFTKAFNCEQAYNAIIANAGGTLFELVLVDYRLPAYEQRMIFNGCDVAKLARKKNPNCKVVLITAQTEILVVYDILQKVHPEALALKNDIDGDSFSELIKTVLDGNFYQSETVKSCLAKIWDNSILADEHNREILLNLEKGYKISELHTVIPLAEITIKKRIGQIRKALQINSGDNLLFEIKKRGVL